jgi:DNA-binding beta-propeller fold protein YncE
MPEIRAADSERSLDLRRSGRCISTVNRSEFLRGVLAVPFAPSLLAGGAPERPFALVTADLDAQVIAVDLSTARAVARIPTQWGPRSIEAVARGRALIAHTEIGRVSLVDSRSLRVQRVLRGFREPRYTAARGRIAYVTDSARGELVAVDTEEGSVVGRASVPGPARHVTITADGVQLWTALGSKAAEIAVLDVGRLRVARTLRPPFLAHDVVAAPDGEHVWVTSGDSRRIAVYSRLALRPLELLPTGAPPQHVAFIRGLAFVASGNDGTVRAHQLDGTLVHESEVPVGSYNVTFGAGRAVTPSLARGTVAVLDERGRVRAVRRVARAAHDACVISRGGQR